MCELLNFYYVNFVELENLLVICKWATSSFRLIVAQIFVYFGQDDHLPSGKAGNAGCPGSAGSAMLPRFGYADIVRK